MGQKRETLVAQNTGPMFKKTSNNTILNNGKTNAKSLKSFEKSSKTRPSYKKKTVINIIKSEFEFISSLFNILDISSLHHGRRNVDDEDEESGTLQILDIPEKKTFQKQGSKKGTQQPSSKSKQFPQTVEGLQKELADMKGSMMTYQKKLRKKGLQARLNKKIRKEEIKKRKSQPKQGQKHSGALSGPAKLMRPVLNSDGLPVSNKFDFADSETKKDSKKKLVSLSNESNASSDGKLTKHDSFAKKKNMNNSFSVNQSAKSTNNENLSSNNTQNSLKINGNLNPANDTFVETKVKKEKLDLENSVRLQNSTSNSSTQQGPMFNKENKLVFSKVYIPENRSKKVKKKTDKDPKKILEKLKENSKKIKELEKEDKEKASLLKEKQKWATALKRASGEKVKDDPELLKKSIGREKNKKMRSQKKWQERTDRVQKDKEEKQKKRTDNIQTRKNEKKKRKMKKAIKKGSFVQL